MGKYILALDQGTTSSRAILFDSEQNILAIRQHELTQHYPHEGWVEQDPMEIWSTQYAAMLEVLAAADVSPSDVAGIGITNQRETTILWDKNTGRADSQRHRLAVPPHSGYCGQSWCRTVCPGTSAARPVWFRMRIFRERKSSGCSTMWRAHERRPSAEKSCSAR